MKKSYLLIALSLLLVGVGCSSQDIDHNYNLPGVVTDNSIPLGTITEAFGITFPEDSEVATFTDDHQRRIVTGSTDMSIRNAKNFFDEQLEKKGLEIARGWGESSFDSRNAQSATYRGEDTLWIVNLRKENGKLTFDLQVQK